MHVIHIYFLFLPLAPSTYWASNRDFISNYAEYVEFVFFTKESLSEDRSDSGVETCNNSQGNDDFFQNFSIKFYSGNEVFSEFW